MHECRLRAPISRVSVLFQPSAHPMQDADCAQVEIHTKNPGTPLPRSPRKFEPLRFLQFYLPAQVFPILSGVRLLWVYMPAAREPPGTLLSPVFLTGLPSSFPVPARNAAMSPHLLPPPLSSSVDNMRFQVLDVVHMVIERSELAFLVSLHRLSYARSTACIPSVRLCVRGDGCSCAFPSTGGLPSIPSAPCGLFGNFSGTVPPSDCLHPFIIGLRPWTFQCSPVYYLRADAGSPSSRARCFRACTGSQTAQSCCQSCIATDSMLPSVGTDHVGTLKYLVCFRSSMADLLLPRSTLRMGHCCPMRMIWGHSGLLNL